MNRLFSEFFLGINYWGSESAINMWSCFNPASVEADMRLMQDAGITHLRVFPLWPVFQPLHAIYGPDDAYEYAFGEEPLPDTPAGRAGVSEEACQNFEKFCRIAEKYGMKLIVGLITGHMSFRTYNPPAFNGKKLLSDPTVMKWQRRFVQYFVTRFRKEPSIIGWDLGNEVLNMPGTEENPDAFYVWGSFIADAIRACDDSRPVISGLDHSGIERGRASLKEIGEFCDVHTTHPYNIFNTSSDPLPTMKPLMDLVFKCRLCEDVGKIPVFTQEFGSIGYMNCSRESEAAFYRCSLLALLAHGGHGAMWWCAFDQGHMRFAPYRWNNIGSDYGFYDRERKPKPIVGENMEFRKRLAALPGGKLPDHTVNGVILVPRDDGNADLEVLRASFILAKQANLDMAFSYALDPIPDAPLYILPSVRGNKTITGQRLDELMEKVAQGAVLYISTDDCLMRDIPEITGVCIRCRERIDAQRVIRFGDAELPVRTSMFLHPESCAGEMLAADENGEGVFFRMQYGKGTVCFLTLPLERHLAEENGAFYRNDRPPYDRIYRRLAEEAGVVRAADSDHPYIRLTEHLIDEDSRYVFAINYSDRPAAAELRIQSGFTVEAVFGSSPENGMLRLRENDGALLRLVRHRG